MSYIYINGRFNFSEKYVSDEERAKWLELFKLAGCEDDIRVYREKGLFDLLVDLWRGDVAAWLRSSTANVK